MKKYLLLTFILLITNQIIGQALTIDSIYTANSVVEQYEKFEVSLHLSGQYENPYDYDQIWVKANMISPSGETTLIDGFFMQDYEMNSINGRLTPKGEGAFYLRFAPMEEGEWSYSITVTDSTNTITTDPFYFQCTAPTKANSKGFIRTDLTNYLHHDNGDSYIPIGENMAWANGNPYLGYKNWLESFIPSGGNFFRLWHAHWGLGIEWKKGVSGFEGLRRYKQTNCFYQDWLFDYCADNGVTIMLTLQHHGPVSTQVNPNWNESPYNTRNGGPCQSTEEFFYNQTAIADTKNRYRYIIARWGYARSILAWELFNEVEWTDNFDTIRPKVVDWHYDMSSFIKENDPNNHLVTTSYAHDNFDPDVWIYPDIDITQTHYYFDNAHLERVLAAGNRRYLEQFEKPTLNGEFGLGGTADLSNADPDGIHLHNNMWGSLFSGAFGTGLTWWWDRYIHPKDLYYHFMAISMMTEDIPFRVKNMKPEVVNVSGAKGDLELTSSAGWGVKGDTLIQINSNGSSSPSNPTLALYLYGKQWNTQYRNPPTFEVNYQEDGFFKVRTSSAKAQGPKIAIYVDSVLILEETALVNTEYSVPISAGAHTIKVDNTGQDWVSIVDYTFTGLGWLIDAYALVSETKEVAAGWVLNNDYDHKSVQNKGVPAAVIGGQLSIPNFANGDYFIKWYDCLSGVVNQVLPVKVTADTLKVEVPELAWDAAFLVDEEEVLVGVSKRIAHLPFSLYPNPALAGTEVNFSTQESLNDAALIELLDQTGKRVSLLTNSSNRITLPKELTDGYYWIKITANNKVGTAPIVIFNQ